MDERPATTSKKAKKRGRKRRVAGWLLLVIAMLVTGAWLASRWWRFTYSSRDWMIEVDSGLFIASYSEGQFDPKGWDGSSIKRYFLKWFWLTELGLVRTYDNPQITGIDLRVVGYTRIPSTTMPAYQRLLLIPWPFALAALLGGGWLVWSGRRAGWRAMAGVCLKCGYDLSGLGVGVACPECGSGTVSTSVASPAHTSA